MTRKSNDQAARRLVAQLEAAGWRIEQHKHYKAYCPCGEHMLVMALSSSDHRSGKNLEAMARRYLRECPGTNNSKRGDR